MRCDEYHRLHAACLIMAEQSKQPEERARWFTLAQDCLGLANDPRSEFRARKGAEDPWLTSRAAIVRGVKHCSLLRGSAFL
jgi:hypothetical protein